MRSNAFNPHAKPDARAKKKTIKAIKSEISYLVKRANIHINHMEKAETINALMRAKQTLLLTMLRSFPFSADSCYFCQLHMIPSAFSDCKGCPYQIDHGNCSKARSSYQKISNAMDKLRDVIVDYWKR